MAAMNPFYVNALQVLRGAVVGGVRAVATGLGFTNVEKKLTETENKITKEASESVALKASRQKQTATDMATAAASSEPSKIEQRRQREEERKTKAKIHTEQGKLTSAANVEVKKQKVDLSVAKHGDKNKKSVIETQGKDDKTKSNTATGLEKDIIHSTTAALITDMHNVNANDQQRIQDESREKSAERMVEGLEQRTESLGRLEQTQTQIEPLQTEVQQQQTQTFETEAKAVEAAHLIVDEFLNKIKGIHDVQEATHGVIQSTVVEAARHSSALDVITHQARLAAELVGLKGELQKATADHQLKQDGKYETKAAGLQQKIASCEAKQKIFAKASEAKTEMRINKDETKALVALMRQDKHSESFAKMEGSRAETSATVALNTAKGAQSGEAARFNEGVTQEMLTDHFAAEDGGFAVTQKILNSLLESQPGMLGQILTNIETSKAEADAKVAAEREPTASPRM